MKPEYSYAVESQLRSGEPLFHPINQEGGIESWVCPEGEVLWIPIRSPCSNFRIPQGTDAP
eukprot:4054128-Prorocentrum_lima.AAC.1